MPSRYFPRLKRFTQQMAIANYVNTLGNIYHIREKYKDAIKALSDTQDLYCLRSVGMVRQTQNKHEDAFKALSEAQEI